MLLGGDEDLEVSCCIQDGEREGRPNSEAGVTLLTALLLECELEFLLDLERGAHVSGDREPV